MPLKHALTRFITSCFLVSFLGQADAVIVRMDFDFGAGTVTDQVYIELFDSKAPGTVTNFLNYVEDATGRRYDNTFIHRSITGFIVQGGGFTFDSSQPEFKDQATALTRLDDPIKNEFDPSDQERSNIRGTIAMAKVGNNPDSATSDWFFNLADNSSNLDTQNEGFTVFARVLCDTSPAPATGCDNMDIVDKFATAGQNSLSIEDLDLPPETTFDTVPLVNHAAGAPVATTNLVRLANVEVLNLIQPSIVDFGPRQLTITHTQTVTVENQTDFTFTILSVAEDIRQPFSVVSGDDGCSNKLLGTINDPLASRTCTILVSFHPELASINNSSFSIKTDNVKLPSLTVWLSGNGSPQEPTISFSPPLGSTLQFGSIGPGGDDRVFDLTIRNLGIDVLTVDPFGPSPFTGTGTENLALSSNCSSLAAGDSCTLSITFSRLTEGIDTDAQLKVLSNDPARPSSIVPITGSTSADGDGVSDAIEAGVSDTGDGNFDGIADAFQDNVTSLPDTFGRYITLETEPGVRLTGVRAIGSPTPDRTPRLGSGTLEFSNGFFFFLLRDVPVGGRATVTFYLPEGQTATHYFKFGRVPSDFITRDILSGNIIALPAHWYSFAYNGDTGAEILGDRIVLHFRDGGPGDDDLEPNGRILDPGGPATASASGSSSSSGGGGCSLSTATDDGKSLPVDFVLLLLSLFILRLVRTRRPAH